MALRIAETILLWLFTGLGVYMGYRDGIVRRRINMTTGLATGRRALFNGIGVVVAALSVAVLGTLMLWGHG